MVRCDSGRLTIVLQQRLAALWMSTEPTTSDDLDREVSPKGELTKLAVHLL